MSTKPELFVVIDGQAHGPIILAEVQDMIGQGKLTRQSLYWQAGMTEWSALDGLLQPETVAAIPPAVPAKVVPPAVPPAPASNGSATPATPAALPMAPATAELELAPIISRVLGGLIDGIILLIPFWIGEIVIPLVGGLLIYVLYTALMMASESQATIGMKIMNIKLVDEHGAKVKNDKAFIRALVSIPSSLVLWFGYLWALFNPKSQTLHDVVANTYVVSK
ncbi:RDD family protein [Andreprevotia chitinilytica]|uniref:RDD family protein n=1 Tax=Andreprevotia chitinilytica TaxID=396808 RepID=UPI00068C6003|nr:RDD family protein [Andreprevotia chitinilytica]